MSRKENKKLTAMFLESCVQKLEESGKWKGDDHHPVIGEMMEELQNMSIDHISEEINIDLKRLRKGIEKDVSSVSDRQLQGLSLRLSVLSNILMGLYSIGKEVDVNEKYEKEEVLFVNNLLLKKGWIIQKKDVPTKYDINYGVLQRKCFTSLSEDIFNTDGSMGISTENVVIRSSYELYSILEKFCHSELQLIPHVKDDGDDGSLDDVTVNVEYGGTKQRLEKSNSLPEELSQFDVDEYVPGVDTLLDESVGKLRGCRMDNSLIELFITVFHFINRSEQDGVTVDELSEEFAFPQLRSTLQLLTESCLIYSVLNWENELIISHAHASAVIPFEGVRCIRPWIGLNGEVNSIFFNILKNAVLSCLTVNPGLDVESISRKLSLISPAGTKVLLREMEEINLIHRKTVTVGEQQEGLIHTETNVKCDKILLYIRTPMID